MRNIFIRILLVKMTSFMAEEPNDSTYFLFKKTETGDFFIYFYAVPVSLKQFQRDFKISMRKIVRY